VTITRNGAAFATLAPARPEKPRKPDWVARFKRRPPLGRKLNAQETQSLYDAMRGDL
jgi:antitoxin (DNA-binding transcriptional repressor) of toxin-antitoxin stability system